MPYYHDLITEKSWELVQELARHYNFILIGGWAVFLYTKTLKSKDIDIIVEYDELEKLKNKHQMQKNDRLKKYEIRIQGIDIDIYVPFFSNLGIPVEQIRQFSKNIEGFTLPEKEILLILKQKAWEDRGHSLKGEKDKIDIISLIASGIDWKKYKSAVRDFNLSPYIKSLIGLLESASEARELNLLAHQFSKIKKSALAELGRK